jgi:hypothetical protein
MTPKISIRKVGSPRLTPGDLLNLMVPVFEQAGYECRSFSDADLVVQSGATVVHVNFEIFSAPAIAGGAPDDGEADVIAVDSWQMDDGAPELDHLAVTGAAENEPTEAELLAAFRRVTAVSELRKKMQ